MLQDTTSDPLTVIDNLLIPGISDPDLEPEPEPASTLSPTSPSSPSPPPSPQRALRVTPTRAVPKTAPLLVPDVESPLQKGISRIFTDLCRMATAHKAKAQQLATAVNSTTELEEAWGQAAEEVGNVRGLSRELSAGWTQLERALNQARSIIEPKVQQLKAQAAEKDTLQLQVSDLEQDIQNLRLEIKARKGQEQAKLEGKLIEEKKELDREKQQLALEKQRFEREKQLFQSEKQRFEKESFMLVQEKVALEAEKFRVEKENKKMTQYKEAVDKLEEEKAIIEQEKARLWKERTMVEQDKCLVDEEKKRLQKDKSRIFEDLEKIDKTKLRAEHDVSKLSQDKSQFHLLKSKFDGERAKLESERERLVQEKTDYERKYGRAVEELEASQQTCTKLVQKTAELENQRTLLTNAQAKLESELVLITQKLELATVQLQTQPTMVMPQKQPEPPQPELPLPVGTPETSSTASHQQEIETINEKTQEKLAQMVAELKEQQSNLQVENDLVKFLLREPTTTSVPAPDAAVDFLSWLKDQKEKEIISTTRSGQITLEPKKQLHSDTLSADVDHSERCASFATNITKDGLTQDARDKLRKLVTDLKKRTGDGIQNPLFDWLLSDTTTKPDRVNTQEPEGGNQFIQWLSDQTQDLSEVERTRLIEENRQVKAQVAVYIEKIAVLEKKLQEASVQLKQLSQEKSRLLSLAKETASHSHETGSSTHATADSSHSSGICSSAKKTNR